MKKLIITNLSFKFHNQENYFFHTIDLTFESGKIYFVQGKNGVGKSTFFSILQGTTPRNALLTGSFSFDNQIYVIEKNNIDIKLSTNIKTMQQDCDKMVINTMTVKENIELAQLPKYPTLKPLSLPNALPAMLHDFGINELTPVCQLSGGQKQILAIIMILHKPTKILLLDEPTAALDDINSHIVMKFLDTLALNLDLIVIIITHDKELTESYTKHQKITIIKKNTAETRTILYN